MLITPFQVAQTFVGIKELPGNTNNPLILAMIQTCNSSVQLNDEVPWCSAFVNFVAKLLKLPRTHSLAAKSWLDVGHVVTSPGYAQIDSDIVILNRTANPALGHVGFFAGLADSVHYNNEAKIYILGGNQNNSVSLQAFPLNQVAGIRRLI